MLDTSKFIIPASAFKKEESSREDFQETSPGTFVLEEFLNNSPAWLREKNTIHYTKKKLGIDLTSRLFDTCLRQFDLYQILEWLVVEKGFDITAYVDEIQYIDYPYFIEPSRFRLLGEGMSPSYSADMTEIDRQWILELIGEQNSVAQDQALEVRGDVYHDIEKPQLKIIMLQLAEMKITEAQLKSIHQNFPNLEEIIFSYCEFDFDAYDEAYNTLQPSKVRTLIIKDIFRTKNCTQTVNVLQKAFPSCINLDVDLSRSNRKYREQEIHISLCNLLNIRAWSCNIHIHFTIEPMKSIYLIECSIVSSTRQALTMMDASKKRAKSVTLIGCDYDSQFYHCVLNSGVVRLSLQNSFIEDDVESPDVAYPNIKYVDILEKQTLKPILRSLAKMINLEHLKLYLEYDVPLTLGNNRLELTPGFFRFPKLQSLELLNPLLMGGVQVFAKKNQLKRLVYYGDHDGISGLNRFNLSLSKLTELEIRDEHPLSSEERTKVRILYPDFIEQLVSKAKKIERIELCNLEVSPSDVTEFAKKLVLWKNSMSHVRTLTITKSNLVHCFGGFIGLFSNLFSLTLSGCAIPKNMNHTLNSIKVLNLSLLHYAYPDIDAELDMTGFLSKFIDVMNVSINYCGYQYLNLSLNSNLKNIELGGTLLSEAELLSTIDSQKNLNSISIRQHQFGEDFIAFIKKRYPAITISFVKYIKARDKNSDQFVDADTTDREVTFHVNQKFIGLNGAVDPSPTYYRDEVYNYLEVNPEICDINQAFIIRRVQTKGVPLVALPWPTWNQKFDDDFYYYYNDGLQDTNRFQHGILRLDSWHPNEEILEVVIDCDFPLQLMFDPDEQFHYLVTDPSISCVIQVAFIHRVPKARVDRLCSSEELLFLKPFVDAIIYIQNFESKPLVLAQTPMRGVDYLQAIWNQRTGACRHRTIQGFNYTCQAVTSQMVINTVHAFLEVKLNGNYVRLDLGGYPAHLEVKKMKRPEVSDIVHQKTILESQKKIKKNPYIKRLKQFLQSHRSQSLSDWLAKPIESGKRNLVEIENESLIEGCILALIDKAKQSSIPLFIARNPRDLVCQTTSLKRSGKKGIMTPAPSGPFYDFIQTHFNEPCMIVILFQYFSISDMVRNNSIIDDHNRHSQLIPLPKLATIVALQVMSPDCYSGGDLTSRMDTKSLASMDAKSTLPMLPRMSHEVKPDAMTVNLYHDANWRASLINSWGIDGNDLTFYEGALFKAIRKGKSLVIENPPANSESWNTFLTTLLSTREFTVAGELHLLPESWSFMVRENPYNFSVFKNMSISYGFQEQASPLCSLTLSNLFDVYEVNEKLASLHQLPGLLRSHQHKILDLNLISDLHPEQWIKIFDKAHKLNCQLRIHVSPYAELPDYFPQLERTQQNMEMPTHSMVIHSNDMHYLIRHDFQEENPLIIDVKNYHPSDLLVSISGRIDENQKLYFQNKTGALLRLLDQGHTLALTGNFSPDMVEAVSLLLVSRMTSSKPIKGKLLVFTKDRTLFSMFPIQELMVSVENKKSYLGDTEQLSRRIIETENILQLSSRLGYLRRTAANNKSDDNWKGMLELSSTTTIPGFSIATAHEDSLAFFDKRHSEVEAVLKTEPMVVLTGLSGTGKTTYVEETFSNMQFYRGKSAIRAWLSDKSAKPKIIFLDEANKSDMDWLMKEGFYLDPPRVVVGDEIFYPDTFHKAIFAINPLGYGHERNYPEFFANHGNAVVFDIFTPNLIYTTTLKPLFVKAKLEEKAEALSVIFLSAYQYISSISKDEVLISPREVKMMLLLTVAHVTADPMANIFDLAKYYTYLVGRNCIPSDRHSTFEHMNQSDPVILPYIKDKIYQGGYISTPSRLPYESLLEVYCVLRTLISDPSSVLYKERALSGLIIEGPPGEGKSQMIDSIVSSRSLVISPALTRSQMKDVFKQALAENKDIVIHEFNTLPFSERFLIKVMGASTAMIFATQNSVSMGGRKELPIPIKRRMLTVTLPAYQLLDMQIILEKQGITQKRAAEMVTAYRSLSKSLQNFRDFQCFVTEENKPLKRHSSSSLLFQHPDQTSEKTENEPPTFKK